MWPNRHLCMSLGTRFCFMDKKDTGDWPRHWYTTSKSETVVAKLERMVNPTYSTIREYFRASRICSIAGLACFPPWMFGTRSCLLRAVDVRHTKLARAVDVRHTKLACAAINRRRCLWFEKRGSTCFSEEGWGLQAQGLRGHLLGAAIRWLKISFWE